MGCLLATIERLFNELERQRRYQYMAMVAIVLLAIALRFYRLGEWSFWGDEVITLRRARNLLTAEAQDQNLTYFLTGAAVARFGLSEWSARLPAAMLGVALVPTLYLLVREAYDGGTAVLAALFLALSPWHLYWSQSARFYTPLLLFYTLALFAFYFGFEKDNLLLIILGMLLLGLAAVERAFALFFVPVITSYLALILLLRWPRPPGLRPRNLLIFYGPGLVLGLWLAIPIIREPERWVRGFSFVNNSPLWVAAGMAFYVGLITVIWAIIGGLGEFQRRSRIGLLLALNCVVPLAALLIISVLQYSANRYLFVTLPSWLVLAAVAARQIWLARPKIGVWLALAVLASLTLLPLSENILYYVYQNGNRENARAALNYVAARQQPGDLVIVPNKELANYYIDGRLENMGTVDVATLQSSPQPIWLIEDMTVSAKWPQLAAWLHREPTLVAEFDVTIRARTFTMRVYRYEPR